MTWFKTDDSLHSHKKAMRAGVEAMGLWVLAGSWCADQLTDGWIPDYAALRLAPNAEELAERLVKAGLWEPAERDGEPGWIFHDWEQYQPSRADVEARRRSDAERRARWRHAKKSASSQAVSQDVSRRDTPDDSREESRQASVLPDPTRPDPSSSNEELPAREARGSDRFEEFWDAYPRKTSKKAARTAWSKATKKASPDELISEARRWSGLWTNAGVEKQFIPHPSTWLNGERWTDEPPPPRLRAVAGGHQPWTNPTDPSAYEGEL